MGGSLKESLRSFGLPKILVDDLESPWHLPKAWEEIRKDFESKSIPPAPSGNDLNLTYSYLKSALEAGTPVSSMDKKHLKRAPWVIFDPHRSKVLAADLSFSEGYLRWLRTWKRTSTICCLIFSFLKEYPREIPYVNVWRQAIYPLLESSESLRLRRWLNAASRFYLLEEDGPQKFAELLLNGNQAPDEILEAANLKYELANQGFSKWAFKAALVMVETRLSNDSLTMNQLDRLMLWSRNNATSSELRYPNEKALLAESLLRPFARRKAPEEMKKKIKSFLLSQLGDPHLQRTGWFGVSEQCIRVMSSWLIEASLEHFFRVLDHTADPIWRYRKAFWGAFFDRGHIREAWPVLGRNARDALYRASRDTEDQIFYGTLKGVEPRQSVLLLVIGDLLIAEWSHNGKCRIWRLEDEARQSLKDRWFYNTEKPVRAEELRRLADIEVVHNGSEYGRWQERLYGEIHQYTGITIPKSHLMPRGMP